MIILGIDPGIGRTGWGVIESVGSKVKSIDYGCFETPSADALPDRLVAIKHEIVRIIEKHKPEKLGIEELFFNTNAKTALIVGQARGAVIVTAADLGLEVFSYTPLQVKIALTGYGRAEKDQMGKMVKIVLSLPQIPKPDDTVDALACALACAFTKKF